MDRDVEYHERYNALKTLIHQAREISQNTNACTKKSLVKRLRSTQYLVKTG